MKRIFYYSEQQLVVSHWQHKTCVASYVFNTNYTGLNEFKLYLKQTQNIPARILIDLIDEDFKKEIIPHVGRADKKSIINRLNERQYKNSKDYIHYQLIGRQKNSRKDDILLCSTINNPKTIEPLLNVLLELNTAISGIWSLALLNETLFSTLKISELNVLLITQQNPDYLRQTFIQNKKIHNSRLSKTNIENNSIGESIFISIEQTINFLSNHQYIKFNDDINIHIICNKFDEPDISEHCTNTASRYFHFHNANSIADKLNFNIEKPEQSAQPISNYCSILYSYICAKKIIPIGQYGKHSLFSRYYEKIFSKSLNASSLALILLFVVFSFSSFAELDSINNNTQLLISQTKSINNQYTKNFSEFLTKLSVADLMQSSVLLSNEIQNSKMLSPQKFILNISQTLNHLNLHHTTITGLDWSRKLAPETSISTIYQHAIIKGEINLSKKESKKSINEVNLILDEIKKNPQVLQAKIIRSPINSRSMTNMENNTNMNTPNNIDLFEIELLMSATEYPNK